MRVRQRAGFGEIFPNEQRKSLRYYLDGISSSYLKEFALHILSVSNYKSDYNNWRKLLFKKWFKSPQNRQIARDIYVRVLSVKQTMVSDLREGSYIMFNKTCSMVLLEEVMKINYEGIEKADFHIEIDLFKAILLINESLGKVGSYPKLDEDMAKFITPPLILSLTVGFSQYPINNNNAAIIRALFACQFRKAKYLFKFIYENQRLMFDEFIKKYDCRYLVNYMNMLYFIIYEVLDNKNSDLDSNSEMIYFSLDNNGLYNRSFIQRLTATTDAMNTEQIDFKVLRAQPLIETEKDHYYVVDESFMIQKVYDSLYFEFKDINDNITKSVIDFRPYYTYEFSEKVLLYNVLDSIFKRDGFLTFDGCYIDKFKKGGCDYYIRNGKDIFIFENKDIFVSAVDKMNNDFSKNIKMIDKKLVDSAGLPQLINNIKFIMEKSLSFDTEYDIDDCNVFPILVTHKNELDCPGVNTYLNYRFAESVKKIGLEKKINLHNLTVINIDAFIVYDRVFKEGIFDLSEAIDIYHSKVYGDMVFADVAELQEKLTVKVSSFYMFLMGYYSHIKNVSIKDELYNKNLNDFDEMAKLL